MNRCHVVYSQVDGSHVTYYVYGPTAEEYKAEYPIGSVSLKGIVIGVYDVYASFQEDRRTIPWWEKEQAPTHYFFNPHLSRERISPSASSHSLDPSVRGSSEAGDGDVGAGEGDGGRPDRLDGDAE